MFHDRDDAARQLCEKLTAYAGDDTVVVGLARGGVVLAYRIAQTLGAALGVLIVRKLGAPFNPELAIEAVKRSEPRECILAIPVASPRALRELEPMVDRLICLHSPEYFYAVGQFYSQFTQVTDGDVIDMLRGTASTVRS